MAVNKELLSQLDAIDSFLDNPVNEDEIETYRRILVTLNKAENAFNKLERSGYNVSDGLEVIRGNKNTITKILREYG